MPRRSYGQGFACYGFAPTSVSMHARPGCPFGGKVTKIVRFASPAARSKRESLLNFLDDALRLPREHKFVDFLGEQMT